MMSMMRMSIIANTTKIVVFENYDMHGSKVTRSYQISQIPTPHPGVFEICLSSSVEMTAPK